MSVPAPRPGSGPRDGGRPVPAAVRDVARLRDLAGIDLDDPRLRRRLDAIAERTRAALGLDVGLLTVVLDSAQVVVGSAGLTGWVADAGGTPVEWAFCSRLVETGRPYVVEDARTDELQHDNPLVALAGVGSYLGVPLTTPSGHVIGGHCVLTHAPHRYTDEDLAVLAAAAQEADAVLEEYRRTAAPAHGATPS